MIYTITLNPAIDRLIFLQEVLTKRKTNRSFKVLYDIGGKGTHGSYAMSRLGIENKALGFAGAENSQQFYEILAEKKIQHYFFPITAGKTRESIVMIDPHNQGSTMVTEPSFEVPQAEKEKLLDFIKTTIQGTDCVLVAGSLPLNFSMADLQKLLVTIQETGCFLACDLADEALELAIRLQVDFIKPNEFELQRLLTEGQTTAEQLQKLAESMTCIVASQGEKGSVCYYAGKQYHIAVPKVKEINDTGAGDCFVGSFLAVFHETKDIEKALKIASGCAASKVKYEDSSYFDVEEAKELAEKVQIKLI